MHLARFRCPVFIAAGGMLLVACGRPAETAQPAPPPPPQPPVVLVTPAVVVPQKSFTQAVARLAGSASTQVRSPVAGFLIRQVYGEGAIVKQGDVLFVINPHPFEKKEHVAEAGYIQVLSPTAGATSRSSAAPGDAVAANAILTTISALDPIAAEFSAPPAYLRTHHDELEKELALPPAERPEEFELAMDGGAVYPAKGRLGDGSLGSGGLRALFPNPDRVLLPGQYVRVNWRREWHETGVVVPASSVRGQEGGATVAVVKSDNTIEERRVSIWSGSESSCTVTGLRAGEQVVVINDGRIANGARVTPQLYIPPIPKAP